MVWHQAGRRRRILGEADPWPAEAYGPAHEGTKEIDTEPHDMFYCDIAPLPPVIHIDGGKTFPLPLAVIAAVINRSSHRIINPPLHLPYHVRLSELRQGHWLRPHWRSHH